jgi:hypothetical protein
VRPHPRRTGVPDAASAARRENSAGFWGWPSWERLAQDVRLAARGLRKTPSFTAVAVATLAVGLGINTAVYSVVNALMVRALPYPNADWLLSLAAVLALVALGAAFAPARRGARMDPIQALNYE